MKYIKNLYRFMLFNLFFIFVLFLFPSNVYAEQVSSTFSGNYYAYTQEARIPNSLPSSYSSNLNQDDSFPNYTDNVLLIAQSNGVWYGMKRIALVNTNFQFRNGVSYTIRLDFQFLFQDNYLNAIDSVERSYTLYSTSSDNNFTCTNALCSVTYEKSNGYFSTTISFIPTSNFTGTTIVLGSFDAGKVLFANHSGRNMVMNIRSSTITYFNDASNGDIINNNNQNTQQIINNNNQNTQSINNNLENINDTLTDDNVDEAENTAGDFFNDFMEDTDTHGLVGIIQAPLNLLRAINTNSNSCTALSVPLPFVNQSASLPCMKAVVDEHWPNFLWLYQMITDGIIGYWVAIKIVGHVKSAQDPTDDKIEVIDL